MTTLIVLHSGLIGAKIEKTLSVVGSYTEKTYKENVLKTIQKLQANGHTSFSVPNRCIRVLIDNDIPGEVHNQDDIKDYLEVFNYLDKISIKQKENIR